jgi:hypothetical protein
MISSDELLAGGLGLDLQFLVFLVQSRVDLVGRAAQNVSIVTSIPTKMSTSYSLNLNSLT